MSRISVPLPVDITPQQLAATASVFDALATGQWDDLARSFTRMAAARAVVPEPMGALVGNLAQRFRAAAEELVELEAAP